MGWYLSFGVGPLRYRSSKRRVYTHNGCALQHSTKAKAVACHAARDRVSAAKAARAWKREQALAAMPPDVRAAVIRKDRRSEARINLAVWVFLLTIIGLIGWGFVTLTKPPEPQPWVGRDVYGDGKCFNNQDTPVPCPDTGWVPSGRTHADQTATPTTSATNADQTPSTAAPLTPTENDGPFWSAVQTRTGFTGTQARFTAINHGRFICRELADGTDSRIVGAMGVADVQYTPEQFQTVMTTAIEFLCPEQAR